MKKSISVFLVLAMLAALFTGVGVVANAAGLSYTAEVSPAELSESTEAQEITIVFKATESFAACSLECNVVLPSDWTITELKNDSIGTTSGNVSIGTKTDDETIDLNKGKIFWYSSTADDVTGVTEIATVKATIPANTSGDFDAKIENIEIAKNFGDDSVASSDSYTQTITITGSTPPSPAAEYIVTISDGVDGTAEVEIGDPVTMTVTVTGGDFNGLQGKVKYDKDLFELKSVSGDAADDDEDTVGTVELCTLDKTTYSDGAEVATLKFEAKAAGKGDFTVAATVGDFDDFKSKDAVYADAVNDSVTVKEPEPVKYTVTVASVEHATLEANTTEAAEGDPVTITVTVDSGWQIDSVSAVDEDNTSVTVTDNEDGTYSITMPASNITVTATVSEIPATKYAVNVPTVKHATVEATKTEAAEGDPVTITVTADSGWQIDSVTVKDGTGADVTVTDNGDGTYTLSMPASEITVTVAVSEIAPAFTVKVTEYVTGINLVLVKGEAAGYTYGSQAMYDASAKYGENDEKVFVILDDSLSGTEEEVQAAAAAKVVEATATAADHVLAASSYEVNGTSKVDFNDAGAAFGCYNAAYTLADNIAMYLRADVDASKTVDGTDVSAIMDNYS